VLRQPDFRIWRATSQSTNRLSQRRPKSRRSNRASRRTSRVRRQGIRTSRQSIRMNNISPASYPAAGTLIGLASARRPPWATEVYAGAAAPGGGRSSVRYFGASS